MTNMRAQKPLLQLALVFVLVAPVPAFSEDWAYLDDRSTPQKLVESYYFAISHRYYAQAYGYFQDGAAPADFDSWAKGYSDTGTVTVKFGATAPDPGAGQIFWALPVAISAAKTDGTTQVFTGCYKIHMANPGMQTDPPYQPMGIVSATLKETKKAFDTIAPGPC
ncbi:hypothetical protein [Roseibium sediminicola]|uniref:Uncharacterized protein n=1 Tax=Roseibium sediminicola TaxID=2933272 RepID=A0ABT0GRM4_9HYPH|nr:hypothetical protein [Roseibium sp. CAU 1639]MCK7612095.1 hypothetical protein [Roseibium sp. CAU 1639]